MLMKRRRKRKGISELFINITSSISAMVEKLKERNRNCESLVDRQYSSINVNATFKKL